MQKIDFSHITNGILEVVNNEEEILMSLPEEIITQRLNKHLNLHINDIHELMAD